MSQVKKVKFVFKETPETVNPEQLTKIPSLDFPSLNIQMSEQASTFAYYSGLLVLHQTRMMEHDNVLERLKAKIASAVRTECLAAGGKCTEAMVNEQVNLHPDYIASVQEGLLLGQDGELMKSLVKALEQKKDMLKELSANLRRDQQPM